MRHFKSKVYSLIRDDDVNNIYSNIFDGIIIALILINTVMVIAQTFNVSQDWQNIFDVVEVISVLIFTVEYALRVWTSDLMRPNSSAGRARIRYIFTPMALIDLMAILPFYFPFLIPVDLRVLRMLRMVRLMRLFKLNRYTHALSIIASVFKKKAAQLVSAMIVLCVMMILSSVLIYYCENPKQPGVFQNAFSGLWWAVATFTTVGYGDIYPVTIAGKIFSALIAVLGIGLVAVPTGIISAGFIEHMEEESRCKTGDQNPISVSEKKNWLAMLEKLPERERYVELGRIQKILEDIKGKPK